MKNILKTIIALIILGNFSCDESLLEKAPLDKVTEITYYQTEDHAIAAVNSVYDVLQNGRASVTSPIYFDMMSGNARSDRDGYAQIGRSIHETTNGTVSWWWNWNYKGITRANIVTEKVPEIDMDASVQNRLLAEARFLRAYFYHNLMVVFGDVPLIITQQNVNDEYPGRTAKEQVLEQIIKDLEFAELYLPEKDEYAASDMGRATKGAAKAYLSRVYIFDEQWSKGADKAREVIQSNKYSLVDDYAEQFFPLGENGSESIFEIQYAAFIPGEGQAISNQIAPSGHGLTDLGGYNMYHPLQGLVDSFLATDGQPIATSTLYDPLNPYENRDPRLDFTVLHEGSTILGVPYNPTVSESGFSTVKYIIGQEASAKDDFEQNIILMRYAELLLFYAEAQNEAVGPDQSTYDAINAVRRRVGMPDVPSGLDKDAMREVIRKERRYELAMEGPRYFDLLRWRTAEDEFANKALDPTEEAHGTFDAAKHYLWPIPQNEVDINPNLLPQNPGW